MPLCGVKVEYGNKNDTLIGACVARAVLVTDNLT